MTSDSSFTTSTINDSFVVAPAELEQLEGLLPESHQPDSASVSLFPLGILGELQWRRLPTQIASLLSPPWASALLSMSGDVGALRNDGHLLWERLVRSAPESLTIGPSVLPASLPSNLLALAPASGQVPGWLGEFAGNLETTDPTERSALLAGLYQVHDDLDRSHSYSQSIEGEGQHRNGDHWHAIMHRREPDYGNSKYWYRRVGRSPIFTELAELAVDILNSCDAGVAPDWTDRLTNGGWDPFAFVDLCQHCARTESDLTLAARRIQWGEMLLLMEQTARDAGLH